MDWAVTARTRSTRPRHHRRPRARGVGAAGRHPVHELGHRGRPQARPRHRRPSRPSASSLSRWVTASVDSSCVRTRSPACPRARAGWRCTACSAGCSPSPSSGPFRGLVRAGRRDQAMARLQRRRGLRVVVSDFLSAGTPGGPNVEPDWERPLRRLGVRNQVLCVEVVDRRELEFPDVGDILIRDPNPTSSGTSTRRTPPRSPLRRPLPPSANGSASLSARRRRPHQPADRPGLGLRHRPLRARLSAHRRHAATSLRRVTCEPR